MHLPFRVRQGTFVQAIRRPPPFALLAPIVHSCHRLPCHAQVAFTVHLVHPPLFCAGCIAFVHQALLTSSVVLRMEIAHKEPFALARTIVQPTRPQHHFHVLVAFIVH